jgi:hypothetical protein
VVFGKGNCEHVVYFDARTNIHLKNYLDSRANDNPALPAILILDFLEKIFPPEPIESKE